MATTFTYKVINLNHETADGYVFGGGYTVNANDGTYESSAYGNIEFERPETLVPYADLTEATVVGWIKDQLGADKVTEIEAALQAQLDEQTAPTKASGVPWSG